MASTERQRLKLLGKMSSINVRKVLWTCDEIGIDYDREDWGIGYADPKSPAFLALNPNAMVPVIVLGDYVLWESHAICRFLASLHGRADMLPTDPWRRAQIEKWLDWQAAELNPAWSYAFMSLMRHSPDHQDPVQLAAGIDRWNRHIGIIEQQLEKTGAYIAGDDFTIADIVIGLSLHRWAMTPLTHPEFPAATRYLQGLKQRPAGARYCADDMP